MWHKVKAASSGHFLREIFVELFVGGNGRDYVQPCAQRKCCPSACASFSLFDRVTGVVAAGECCSSLVCLKEGYTQPCQRNIVDLFSTNALWQHNTSPRQLGEAIVSAMWLFS